MARKKVLRTLIPLPAKRRLDRAEHKTEGLVEILRAVAAKNQRDQPRAFYSMREIAAHFEVPFSTVSRVYHRLEREGVLTRVRGARTLLQGLHFDRHHGVRAFVGLPASLSAFITIQPYRTFFIRIRRELRLRGFATGMIFYEKEEAQTAALSERLKAYEVDTVLWFQPPKEARETVVRLSDLGIRLIGISHEHVPIIPCRYDVRRGRAIEELLANWRAQGIDRITIAQWKEKSTPVLEESLSSALEELDIRSSSANFNGQSSRSFLQSLEKLKTGGLVFSSSHLASKLCFRAPAAVIKLLQHRRVAFLNGPVSMPFTKVPDVRVDLVVVDWQWVAEQIVNDLITQDAFHLPGPAIFEADAKLRVPLSDFAQNI
jgi:DNA-binding LacI/PurR family transcriptional regulator